MSEKVVFLIVSLPAIVVLIYLLRRLTDWINWLWARDKTKEEIEAEENDPARLIW